MSDPARPAPGDSLSERLQSVTESLAAAATPVAVFHIVLHPALEALGAIAGVVLLQQDGHGLHVAAMQGYAEGEQTLWQDGTFEVFSPIQDCLEQRAALYFEHQEALLAAYPQLITPPIGVTVVATAVVPVLLIDQTLGVIVLVFSEPHEFTPEERRFLRILAAQSALALDRLTLSTQLQQQAEALSAFAAFTEAVGLNTDLETLTQRAREVLRASFPDLALSYYVLEEERWVPAWLDQVPDDLRRVLVAGLPLDTPAYLQAVQTEVPVFIDHWDGEVQRIPHTETFSAGAFAPYFRQGQPVGMLVAGLHDEPRWTSQHRVVLTALWRGLGGALDRAEQARQLEGRAALDAFVALTEAVGVETDLNVLALRAIQAMQAAQPELGVIYYELAGALWKPRVMSEEIPPEVAAVLRAGLPLETPSLMAALQTHGPSFTEGWDAETEGVAQTESYGAGAFYPYFSQGQPIGLFCIGTQQSRTWTTRDRALFTAVGRSLGLALERAEGVAQLAAHAQEVERSNAKLEAANEELEAFAYSVSHDLRTPVRHIKSFNDLLRKKLDPHAQSDAQITRYLGIVDTAASQMNTLIDAMLDLSRTSRQPLLIRLVDLENLVTAARSELEPEMPDQRVEWTMGPLPLVEADHITLRQVIVNLLANALKYSRTRPEARIEIWAEERPQEWAVFVRDNGVGFDPKYADRLFGVFQRLHRQEEFEGTGIGLANVRRIITRHGGTVFAHGSLGEGATFGFTLPRPP
ncbi:ATP-binding protein [Deinococcus sp. QL22]|uniref:ATP-binding protein n=1 Tax=Deinococcus sp. QL22 TaxID=2939437 RepID=UPI002017AB4E|nr:ATP-binding protein [Deinococcus sp. QL22]UQN10749.1 GAF domain-containing protein [Deinococcus sp. QL22]UQN10795.1 GAF domain-containing protein [Deinococcus sp. QL22]